MYENNQNYPQNTNTAENNNGYQEYYYSASQNINTLRFHPSAAVIRKADAAKKRSQWSASAWCLV